MKTKLLSIILFIFAFAFTINAQAINNITGKCTKTTKSSIFITSIGDINYVPCGVRSSIFTGNVDLSGATVTIDDITGANVLVRGTSTLALNNTTDSVSALFTQSTGNFHLRNASDSLFFDFSVADDIINLTAPSSVEIVTSSFNLTAVDSLALNRTTTASGTTGNVTINKPVGTVNFAAGASDITVTNSVAAATSLIFCTVQSLDATAISCRITNKANGSFHIRVPTATAETSVAFWVTN